MQFNVQFNFLEKRNYIHSTSMTYSLIDMLIKNGFISTLYDIKHIDAAFRIESHNNGYFIINPEDSVTGNSVYNITTYSSKIKVIYVENEDAVSNRVPYDENILVEKAVVDDKNNSIILYIDNVDKLYNVLVATTKKMILNLSLLNDNVKYTPWTLARYSIKWQDIHKDILNKEVNIKLINNLNNTYLKSDIFINNIKYGSFFNARNKIEDI